MKGLTQFDAYFTFNRHIALRLTPHLLRTPLRPNSITTLSMLSGFLAAWCMGGGTRLQMLWGAAFLQLSFILDDCDGEVARVLLLQSRFGMWYDFVADLLVEFALWTGLAMGAYAQGMPPWIWGVAAVACLGSVINFLRVVLERLRVLPAGPAFSSGAAHPFERAMDELSHDGDPSILVWLFALIGYPGYLLFSGALYIHFLWIYPLWRSAWRSCST